MWGRATNPQIESRLRIASHEAELIVRSRDLLAISEALLRQEVPQLSSETGAIQRRRRSI